MSYKENTVFVGLFMAAILASRINFFFSDMNMALASIALYAIVIAVAAFIFKRVDKYKAKKKSN